MANALVLKTTPRTGNGTRDAVRLRKAGLIPATVYGHKENPTSVVLKKDELTTVLRSHARTLKLEVAGKEEDVLIQDIQHNHLGSAILHVDFRRVSADERIKTTVEVEIRGSAPGTNSGGVLDIQLHKLHIECPALAIPEAIRVKVDNLQLGQSIHVKELDLPANVKVLEDPELVVVQVKAPTQMVVATPGLPGEGGVEPEVITKKKEKPAEEE